MKFSSTLLTFIFSGLLLASVANGQILGDYRSVNAPKPGGGNWSDITKWERYNGSSWVAAAVPPTSADQTITISTGDSIVVNGAVTADQLIVATGAFLNAGIPGNNLTLNNGTGTDLTVDGTFLLRGVNTLSGAGDMQVNGVFNWFSGTVAVVTTTSVASVTNLDLDFGKTLSANFTNAGTVNWIGGASNGTITFNSATFTNSGTINEIFAAGTSRGFLNGTGVNAFINNGTLNKTTSTGTFINGGVPFTNNGTLKGIGTFSLDNLSVTNPGTIAPGNSPGILTMSPSGIFGQTGTISIEVVDGSGAGTGHDRLDFTAGTTDLTSATLTVTEALGNAPLQAYTVLTTAGTFTTPFATVNMPSGYIIAYNAASIVVTKLSFPLPAVWGDFTATAKNNTVALKWTTLQEHNTSHFIIEYSTDGRKFSALTTLPAGRSSSSAANYSFIHSAPGLNTNNVYRIRLIDLDGKTDFSAVRSVRFTKGSVVAVQASPNPAKDNLQISVQENNISVRIIDLNGRLLRTLHLVKGVHNVNISDLPSGIYQLMISQKEKTIETQKLIKL